MGASTDVGRNSLSQHRIANTFFSRSWISEFKIKHIQISYMKMNIYIYNIYTYMFFAVTTMYPIYRFQNLEAQEQQLAPGKLDKKLWPKTTTFNWLSLHSCGGVNWSWSLKHTVIPCDSIYSTYHSIMLTISFQALLSNYPTSSTRFTHFRLRHHDGSPCSFPPFGRIDFVG